MRYLARIPITLLLAILATSIELYWYRVAATDGGTLDYVFEIDAQDIPKTVEFIKSKAHRPFCSGR
jgi:hypothetical protein